jgi:hypothetical protein
VSERKTKDWLKAFVEYASYGEAPVKTLWWTGVSTLAGALRRRVWIDQKYFQWTPCFYVVLVAPPGIISKTTTANIGINLLREIPGIKFGPDIVTWQALVQAMGEATEAPPDPTTGEFHPMSALTICSDEFGNFLDPSDRGMVDALVNLWDGKKGVITKITKSSGSDAIENPWLNIIACTTPGWISAHFPEYMIGGGFTSRCIFIYADRKRQLVAYPALAVPKNFNEQKEKLIHDLEVISNMIGEYQLTPEAIEWGTEWYAKHWESPPANMDNERFGGYLARKQTHIHKLAMVLAASRSNELLIHAHDLKFANDMMNSLEGEMPKVFSTIGMTDTTRGMNEVVAIVRRKRRINQSMLYRDVFHSMTSKEFENALNSAVFAGYIKIEANSSGTTIVSLEPEDKGDQSGL